MVTTISNTESQKLHLGDIIDEKKSARIDIFTNAFDSSSELPSFGMGPKISASNRWLKGSLEISAVQDGDIYRIKDTKAIALHQKTLLDHFVPPFSPGTISAYPTIDLRVLKPLYKIENEPEILELLERNTFLLVYLQEAQKKIEEYFGKPLKLSLRVANDPEIEGYRELLISIFTHLAPEEALKKLERFDEEWWLNTPYSVREKVCVDLEFV